MSFILIDRRKSGKGKSTPNRQKLIKRIKYFVKTSTPQNIGKQGGITGNSGMSSGGSSPIKVAGKALEEPFFCYGLQDAKTLVLIGNTEYDRGDEIHISEEERQGRGGGQGEGGEDDFVVNIARDEFLDLYYEDCELPNLVHERFTEKTDNTWHHAGFASNGTPAQLSIIRTYKQSIGRQRAMVGALQDEKQKLEEKLKAASEEEATQLKLQIEELDRKIAIAEGFDDSDLRFRKKEAQPLKTVDAVIFFLMDISGSMGEKEKTIARRWFALQYGFIKRRYPSTELVFIAHTDEAFEMSEDDFFSTRINGGTSASTALKLVNKIIKERYDPNQTNIYVSHASDGDNWEDDNQRVYDEMLGEGNLLAKIQLFNYVEVGDRSAWAGAFNNNPSDSGLWSTYSNVQEKVGVYKLILALLPTPDECYHIFKKVFKKK
jgi:uncharacterized sporulation protein YeaH/YhbH (DUF444 family)